MTNDQGLIPSFEYVLPAIRGIQAGREYYVSMCPVRFIPKLFAREDEENPPDQRVARSLNSKRVPDMANYILNNPDNYTVSAITAAIDADINFEPIGIEKEGRKMGRLRVPMDARFQITDGQHRCAAFEWALKQNPALGYETVAVILVLDIGLRYSQQMFLDLNRYGVHPDASLAILYDHRHPQATVVKAVIRNINVFRTLIDKEHQTLPVRSGKLFTLHTLYNATSMLLADWQTAELEQQIDLAIRYWQAVSYCIPDWEAVRQRTVSAREMRQDYVHSHAIALLGLGAVGSVLLSVYPHSWEERLQELRQIDWLRSNPDWEGRIMVKGQISRSRTSIGRMVAYLKGYLGLPLTSQEEELENASSLVGRENSRQQDQQKQRFIRRNTDQFIVILSACGNPDFRQTEDIGVPTLKLPVHSLEEASQICQGYILEYELGGGNWTGGQVLDARTNEQVGYIACSGKIWTELEDWMKLK